MTEEKMIKGLLKILSNLVNDMVLLVILVAVLVMGVVGVKASYRSPFVSSGIYEMEEFDDRLSLYQFGRVSPFYSFGPENDWIEVEGLKKTFSYSEKDGSEWDKLKDIYGGVAVFVDQDSPKIELVDEDVFVEYVVEESGGVLKVSKRIDFDEEVFVGRNAMSMSINNNEIILDGETGKDLVGISDEWRQKVMRFYGIYVMERDGDIPSYIEVESGKLIIINPLVPGYVEVSAEENQEMYLDKESGYLLITEEVFDGVSGVSMSVTIQGKSMGEK